MPHIEQPIVSSQKSSFAVSFLEEQTIHTAQTLFTAQPHYSFDNWEGRALLCQHQTFQDAKAWTDCIRFQEILLDQKLLLIAGIAVAKSKGRGEECISQNLRILRAKNGRRTIVLFANSQRKERKGYILIPCEFSHTYPTRLCRLADECSVDSVDQIHQEKKGGRPVSLTLRPNSELMSQLKTLQIQFLHENREWHLPLAHYSATSVLTDSSLLFLRPEEILRDFEPSNRRRRHLRYRTLFH
jgi:hypothetical protein